MDRLFSGLYTDFYELTMAQGYFYAGKKDIRATFDLYFRTNPFDGGYAVFAGLEDAAARVLGVRFSDDDIGYLAGLGFKKEFLSYLKDFRFTGDIDGFREGDMVFADDILLRITAPVIEGQILESMLLNIINFQTLIATKTMRIVSAARGRPVVDFGLRRAQGEASMAAARAAYIGGAIGTSNTLAAKQLGVPAIGTHAHSWIQSFESEYAAFKTYAGIYPDATTLLVDTYDTLSSGVPNAIRTAQEMEKSGHQLKAIRLDSGDMASLSRKARSMLDDAGLSSVKIVASNQLDEYLIESLLEQQAPIDMFGVGTKLICSFDQPALDGIYKLCEFGGAPTIKFSENQEKINNPGLKKTVRYVSGDGRFLIDGLLLDNEDEKVPAVLQHPTVAFKKTSPDGAGLDRVFFPVIRQGRMACAFPALADIRSFAQQRFGMLSDEHKRFIKPHTYRVGLSEKLCRLRQELIEKRRGHG